MATHTYQRRRTRREKAQEVVTKSMSTYGYVRLSRLRPDEEGNSLDDQRRRIEGRAMELGTQVDHIFVEKDKSGNLPLADRPEGKKLLARLKRGDRVIATKIDRTFRNAEDALGTIRRFQEQGISLVLLEIGDVTTENGGGVGRVFVHLLIAFSEWERGRIIERIRDSKAWSRDHQRFLGGGRPFGYQIVERDGIKYIAPDPKEQRAIRTMERRFAEGESINALLKWANEHGYQISYRALYKLLISR